MRIGLEDIDPRIAEELKSRLCVPVNEFLKEPIHWGGLLPFRVNWNTGSGTSFLQKKRDPGEDEKAAFALRKKREEQFGIRFMTTVFLPAFIAMPIGAMLEETLGNPVVGVGSMVGMLGLGLGAGVYWTSKARVSSRLKHSVALVEMRAVFPLLRLTRAERIYCDALEMLARTETDASTASTMRDALHQLNDLLKNSRILETRRSNIVSIMGMNNITELEAEFGELGRRLDKTPDPMTRQSLQQSLQMCAARLENARNIEQSMERLNAQQEAIIQTLASTLSAMARLQAAPDVRAEATAHEIAATVAQMNQQTYSVEQAVEEVVTLRAT